MTKYFLTTAIPYVNGKPHLGHTLEYFQADTIRRYRKLLGDNTFLLSGADENALKNVQAAENEGLSTEEYLDKYSKVWQNFFAFLKIPLDSFQRGSAKSHWAGVQKLWQLCNERGDIYKKKYTGFYCIGCEEFKTDQELESGLCPIHHTKPQLIEEENYFFKLSRFQEKLIDLIENNTLKITPANKRAEALSFIKSGLEDFSISRSKDRARGVGVEVPGDSSQIIYVWFDALNIYMTGIGFGTDEKLWHKYWPADLHLIGKDINRFHSVYWPSMLLSAGLPLPKEILIHGFVNISGEKMSKSLGNVIDPVKLITEYGLESVRYFLLSQIPTDSDGEFSIVRLKEVYTSDLSNGLGNLVSRVAKLCQTNQIKVSDQPNSFDPKMTHFLDEYQFGLALSHIWGEIREADKIINQEKPWELKDPQRVLEDLVRRIQHIAFNLQPFLPETSVKILNQFRGEIKSSQPLFPRI